MYKLYLEKTEEPEIKLSTSVGSWKKQGNSRKSSTSALLTMLKTLTVNHNKLKNFFFKFFYFLTLQYCISFCHISTWIHHRYTRVPHPEPSSLLPPHTIPLGCPSAPAPSIQYRASNLDWQLVSYTILYMFQCHSPKSSHPLPLPQSPKDCSIHQCLFCCLVYRVIVTIFLNSIYMC